ncbi:uncharacterized protein ACIB01_016033 isoform 1-T1 [Guaruba guarouba]
MGSAAAEDTGAMETFRSSVPAFRLFLPNVFFVDGLGWVVFSFYLQLASTLGCSEPELRELECPEVMGIFHAVPWKRGSITGSLHTWSTRQIVHQGSVGSSVSEEAP